MKIPLEKITCSDLVIRFEETMDVLSSAIHSLHTPPGVRVSPFIHGQVSLGLHGSHLLIDGQITSRVTLNCSRCLKAFEIEQKIDLHFSARNYSGGQESLDMVILDAQPDEIILTADELDLGELIVQEILLDLPLQPLCTEDCPGLCPRCGRLKGSVECQCDQKKAIDPRWQKLRSLRVR